MKNFKKVLSLVLAFAMVLSTMTIAFAATNDDKAEVLYKLGLFKGVSTTEFDPALDDETTAAQAIALIGRALQWETDEDATVAFTDVPDWAVPYIAYAVDAEITNGVSDTTFGTEYIDGQRMVAWTLRALGYDMTEAWDKTDELAEEAGLTIPEGKLRDDVVAVIYEALTTTPVDGDKTLIEMIVGDDAQLRAVAEAEGLLQPVPEDLEVVDSEALNLIQVQIDFSVAVDKDSVDVDNFSLSKDADASLKDAKADLSEDGKTMLLTFGKPASQQEELTLTLKGLKDTDGEEMTKTELAFKFLDQEIPEVVSAEAIGKDTIKVVFTEPMNVDMADTARSARRDGFELKDSDGKKIYVDDVEMVKNNTEANVSFYSDLKEEVYTLTVMNEYKDYAGYTVIKESVDVPVTPDTEDPIVTEVVSAKPYEVVVAFDSDVKLKSGAKASDFYQTNDKLEAKELPKVDGNEMTIKFASANKLPAGTAYLYIKAETVEDLWGNDNDQQIRVTLNVVGDDVAPVIEKIEAENQKELTVTFDETVDTTTAQKVSNYKILDKDGDEVKSAIRSAVASDKKVTLKLREELKGDHTLVVDNVEDAYGNDMDKVSFAFNVDDVTDPDFADFSATLYDGSKTVQKLVIDFDESMITDGDYSVIDMAKYRVSVEKYNSTSKTWGNEAFINLTKVEDDARIESVEDGTKVEITLDTEDAGYRFVNGTDKLQIARVADSAGNYTAALSETFDIADGANVTVDLDKFEIVSKTEAKIKLKDRLTAFDGADIKYTAGAVTQNDIGDVAYDEDVIDGKTTITMTLLDAEFTADGLIKYGTDLTNTSVATLQIETVASSDVDSNNAQGAKLSISATNAADKFKPEVTKSNDDYVLTASGNKLTLTFTEAVYATSGTLAATDLVVLADGKELVASVDYEISDIANLSAGNTQKTVEITLLKDYATFDGEISVSSADTVNYIKDNAGNKIAEFDNANKTVSIAPIVVSAKLVNDTTVEVTLSEELDTTDTDVSLWTVVDEETTPGPTDFDVTAVAFNADKDVVTLTIQDTSGGFTGDLQLTYTTKTNANEDFDGNDLQSTASAIVVQ